MGIISVNQPSVQLLNEFIPCLEKMGRELSDE